MSKIFITSEIWETYSDDELQNYTNLVFNYYRKNGYPYFNVSNEYMSRVFSKLTKFQTESLLNDGVLHWTNLGLNVVNNFMPHMIDVRCKHFKKPIESFLNDDILRKAIMKVIKYKKNMSDATMRDALNWISGTQRVSNFRPTIAKFIYDKYSGTGSVLDFSSGYGGRLLGALTSSSVKKYTGVEPCLLTYNGLLKIQNTFQPEHSFFDIKYKAVEIFNKPFEDVALPETYDLAFSSPPYFNTEKYSEEDTQSYIRYDTKEKWRDNFLRVLIVKCYEHINKGGYFIINVANVTDYPEFEDDTVRLAKDAGFKYIKTYKMSLASLMGTGLKYEPIFCFLKP